MPANHKVSVAWQVVFTFISILNLWAFYRIRKLRKYLLYVVAPSAVLSIVLISYINIESNFGYWVSSDSGGFDNAFALYGALIVSSIISVGLQALAIYLVIKWSREHNEKYSATSDL